MRATACRTSRNFPDRSRQITNFPLRRDWKGHFGFGVRLVGDRKSAVESGGSTPGTPLAYPLGSYGALDLNADISNSNWTIRVFAKNATDERAYQTIAPVNTLFGTVDHLQGVPIQPRTVGIEVDFRF